MVTKKQNLILGKIILSSWHKTVVISPSSAQEQTAACQGWSLPRSLQDLQLADEIQKMGFMKKLMCVSKKVCVGGGEAVKSAAS